MKQGFIAACRHSMRSYSLRGSQDQPPRRSGSRDSRTAGPSIRSTRPQAACMPTDAAESIQTADCRSPSIAFGTGVESRDCRTTTIHPCRPAPHGAGILPRGRRLRRSRQRGPTDHWQPVPSHRTAVSGPSWNYHDPGGVCATWARAFGDNITELPIRDGCKVLAVHHRGLTDNRPYSTAHGCRHGYDRQCSLGPAGVRPRMSFPSGTRHLGGLRSLRTAFAQAVESMDGLRGVSRCSPRRRARAMARRINRRPTTHPVVKITVNAAAKLRSRRYWPAYHQVTLCSRAAVLLRPRLCGR